MMRFKLLRGVHTQKEPHPNGDACEKCDGGKVQVHEKRGKHDCPYCRGTGIKHIDVVYNSRDPEKNIVRSEVDLQKEHGVQKFQNIDQIAPGADNNALVAQINRLQRENAQLRQAKLDEGKVSAGVASPPENVQGEDDDPDNLSAMTVAELKEFAESLEVDLTGVTKKDEIINCIRHAAGAA